LSPFHPSGRSSTWFPGPDCQLSLQYAVKAESRFFLPPVFAEFFIMAQLLLNVAQP
jgi:hypothetical protein